MRARHALIGLLALLTLTPAAGAHAPASAMGGASFAAPASDKTIATRQRFFGKQNVDPRTGAVRPDRLILSWFGVTNFAAAIRGHVVLLDAWVPRGPHSGYVPTTPEELAQLRPSHILIGHAHFDHAADAVPIAQASGATLVGTAEHCQELQARATSMPPRCVAAVPADAPLGATAAVSILDGIDITAVKHLHSGSKEPDGSDSGGYHVPVTPPPSTTIVDHPPTPQDVEHAVDHAQDAEGGSVLYRFRVAGKSFVWHDTAGPLKDEGPETFKAFEALRPVDVEIGAIQGFNQITNGMRDIRMYMEAMRPKEFVPTHHDDWLIGITTNGAAYEAPFMGELGRMPAGTQPQVRFIFDPQDYVKPDRLTWPLDLGRPGLARRCTRAGLLADLAGEVAHVTSVTFRHGKAAVRDEAAPFSAVFRRGSRGRSLSARVTLVDGSVVGLTRSARC